MSRTPTEVGPTLRMTLFRDEHSSSSAGVSLDLKVGSQREAGVA